MDRASPPAPVLIQFDQTLSEDTLGNKLQPNALTVDNLTVDWLRTRLGDIESSIKECQDKQSRLMADAASSSSSSSNGVHPTSPNGQQQHNGTLANSISIINGKDATR